MFRVLHLKNCYIVNANIPIYAQHVILYFVWCFIIKCCQGHQQTKRGRMSHSWFGCVYSDRSSFLLCVVHGAVMWYIAYTVCIAGGIGEMQ